MKWKYAMLVETTELTQSMTSWFDTRIIDLSCRSRRRQRDLKTFLFRLVRGLKNILV